MTNEVQAIIRASIALQVAALEWENSDINDDQSHKAIEAALKEIQRVVRKLSRSVTDA